MTPKLCGMFVRLRSKLIKNRMRGESFQKWVARNMDNSLLASIFDIFQVIFGMNVTVLYFHKNWEYWDTSEDPPLLQSVHAFYGVLFLLDYVVRLYASDNRQSFVVNPWDIIELVSVAPQFTELIFSTETNDAHPLWFGALKCLRPFRCLRCFRLLAFAKTAKHREMWTLFLGVISIIICFGAVQQAIESCPCEVNLAGKNCAMNHQISTGAHCQDMAIYNAMYFVVITIATLGYGDIAPKSTYGRLTVIILIIASSVLLPLQISTLSDVLNRETEYDRHFKATKEQNPHVLICGDIEPGALDFFLRQFLHPNNLNWKDKVVILSPSLPSRSLKRVLLNAAYEHRVVYLQGSAMLDSDLKRASASTARLCFVMANKLSRDGDINDTVSNFITISLRRYNKRLPIFVQVLKSDNIRHVHLSGANNIVCFDQLKLAILAKSCMMPGMPAFISCILFAFRPFHGDKSDSWASEFLNGCSNDLYEARLPSYLDGLVSFSFLAFILYQEFGMVPIGMSRGDEYRLFPARTKVRSDYTLYVLSSTTDCSRRIEHISLALLQKYHGILPNFDHISRAWNEHSFSAKLRQSSRQLLLSRSIRGSVATSSFFSMNSEGRNSEGRNTESDVATSVKSEIEHRHTKGSLVVPCAVDYENNVTNELLLSTEPVHSILTKVAEEESDKPQELPFPKVLPPLTVPEGRRQSELERRANNSIDGRFNSTQESRSNSQLSIAFLAFLTTPIPEDLTDHIVLCGMPESLADFVAPLRQARNHFNASSFAKGTHHLNQTPVVILSAVPLTEKQHAGIATFPNVYFIYGSPLLLSVLRRGHVAKCKTVVILSRCTRSSISDEDRPELIDDNMMDTDAITLHRFITEFCETNRDPVMPLPLILVVLNRPSSLRFVRDKHDMVLDTPETMEMIQVHKRQVLSRADDPLDCICTPIFASGKVYFPNSLDALLGTCDKYGSVIDLMYLLVLGESTRGNDYGRSLDQIAIPATFWGQPYGACFENLLLQHNILCLGVFRARNQQNSFVYVNPSADVFLNPRDLLFVLR